MTGRRMLPALFHVLLLTTASQLYDVTTIYRFDDLEYVANPECGENEFLCGDGACIKTNVLCNGRYDCPDGSDEHACHSKANQCEGQFRCNNGTCIVASHACDGIIDCTLGEDEALCDIEGAESNGTGSCDTWQFRCNFRSCINASLECNGVRDCSNGLDEDMCLPAEPSYLRMKQASVEIRARTNALGLPVVTNDSIVKVPDTETNIASLSSDIGTISWTVENWKLNSAQIFGAGNETFFELESEEGRLKSPAFFSSFEKICVAVESSITLDSQSSLQLLAENPLSRENFTVGIIGSRNMNEPIMPGWSRHRFLVDVPAEFQNGSIQIVLSAKKSSTGLVFVHSIYGCNVHDYEDVTIILKKYVSKKSFLTAYMVTDRQIRAHEPGPPNDCLHGGSYDIDAGSCRCPVGFMGVLCEQGCGSNRFGNDCGGICSGTLAECKNMIFCRPGTICECATGFKGDFCDSECADGEYGAGCRETCGSCRDSPCDPYTGVCHQGCQPGFYPPFCKTTYKYLISPPEVTPDSYNRLTVTLNLTSENIKGDGYSVFYQVQYRRQGETDWTKLVPRNMPGQISQSTVETSSVNVTNLKAGRAYQIRAVLIDKDGESYQNDDTKSTMARTICAVPEDVAYYLSASDIFQNSIKVDWTFSRKGVAPCPVEFFEVHVKDASRWVVHEVKAEEPHTLVVSDLLPGRTYHVKVRAIWAEGAAPFSQKLAVTTYIPNPGKVRNLRVVSSSSTGLQLQWDRPLSPVPNSKIEYIVEYELLRLLGCLDKYFNPQLGGVSEVNGTLVLLENLVPHAQYIIRVLAISSEAGPMVPILATTNQTIAAVAPDSSNQPVLHLTNTSFVLHWKEYQDCKDLNSYLYGYRYELRLANTSATNWLVEGTTEDTSAEFTGLEPMTEYEARVFLITSAGWNKDQYLVNIVTTKK